MKMKIKIKMKNLLIISILFILLIIIYLYILQENFVHVGALTSISDIKKINELFKKVIILLDKHNIIYWVQGGTLLGAVRNAGIIPWDDDVDISILEEDQNKLLNLKSELNSLNLDITYIFFGYKIYDKNGNDINNRDFKFPFIDIFITKNNNKIIKYTSKQALNIWQNDYFTEDELFPLKNINLKITKYMGRTILIII